MHQKIKFIPMKIHKIVTTRAAHFCPDMQHIWAKMSSSDAPNRLLAGASPQTPLGELTALPQTP